MATNKALQQIYQALTVAPTNRQNVQQPSQQQRGRSLPRKSNTSRAQPPIKIIKQSYASVLTSSNTNPTLIRNINIVGNDDKVAEVRTSLLANTAIVDNGIVAVKRKGKNNFTVFFSNEAGAQKTEQQLKYNYNENIVVKPVNPVLPMVKITGIFTEYEDSSDVVFELKKQNPWLSNLEFKVVRDYTVTTDSGKYMNLIISCDIFIKKASCIFGFSSCKIFEYVDVLRCIKCQRFGHFARDCTCTFIETCRKCHQQHATNTCVLPTINKCSNCINENKKGASFNSKHRTSDERCPLRMERINALKQYYVSSSIQSKN